MKSNRSFFKGDGEFGVSDPDGLSEKVIVDRVAGMVNTEFLFAESQRFQCMLFRFLIVPLHQFSQNPGLQSFFLREGMMRRRISQGQLGRLGRKLERFFSIPLHHEALAEIDQGIDQSNVMLPIEGTHGLEITLTQTHAEVDIPVHCGGSHEIQNIRRIGVEISKRFIKGR